jgi:serine protease Do
MTRWGTVMATAAVVAAGGLGAAWAPSASGQVKLQSGSDRATVLELLGGRSGRLGVSVQEVDAGTAKEAKLPGASGVVIDEVQPDSPAAKAGFRKGDIVVEFDGERVRSTRQFTRVVQESVPGRQVQAVVVRDGQRTTLSVEPGTGSPFRYMTDGNRFDILRAVPPVPPVPPAPPAPADPSWRFEQFFGSTGRLGITVDELSPQLAEYFGASQGVLVTSVADNSAAAKAGLKAGDVVTALDGTAVSSPADLRRRSQRLEDGAEFTLGVVRDRKSLTLKGKVEPRQSRRWTAIV